jgi:Tol biopolymer transport system component
LLESPVRGKNYFGWLSLVVLLVAGASWAKWAASPALQPKVTGTRQITHDGSVKMNLASDGSNLYFTELSDKGSAISKVAASGGAVSKFQVNLRSALLLDVAPNHASLLAAENGTGSSSENPFWIYPLRRGAARRLGQLTGHEAVWAPDGRQVLSVKGAALFLADANGALAKELVNVQGTPYYPRYSPDGKRVRFSVGDISQNTSTIWEINSDGAGLHEVLADWSDASSKCCGNWTADGRYYVFQATEKILGSTGNLFALAEAATKDATSANASDKPIRLTEGAVSFSRPVPAADNKRIWALGLNIRGTLVKYNAVSGTYMPFLAGISATDLDFSADGQWVTYVAVPEATLWRSKIDGSQRQQLTFAPDRAALPRWSPDGKQIAYVNVQEGKPWAIYIVPAEGGASKQLLAEDRTQIDINWSQDGSKIIFGRITQHSSEGLNIVAYDLKTHELTAIPGSEGLFSPRVSPDGRYIAALSGDLTRLMLYNTETKQWSQWQTLPSGALNYPVWSADGKSIYFDDLVSGEGAYCRANVGENHYDHLFVYKGIERHLGAFGLWSGRAPDGSALFVQEASTREIYELQVELP